jgi:hypothetical protein
MKLYTSKTHADEDGPMAEEGKLTMIYGSKEELLALCAFFKKVEQHIQSNDLFHMHLRDNMPNWDRIQHADIEVNLE